MKKIFFISLFSIGLLSCEQKMDACECGKKMTSPESKAALDCNDYFKSLDYKEQEVWMDKALKCYMNEKTGSNIK